MTQSKFQVSILGVPKEEPLSLLLGNLMLHELDMELARCRLRFVRYTADCLNFSKCKRVSAGVKQSMTEYIEDALYL